MDLSMFDPLIQLSVDVRAGDRSRKAPSVPVENKEKRRLLIMHRHLGPAILLLLGSVVLVSGEGSCRASRRCCDGKDGDCVATVSTGGNNDYSDDYDDECYCDHGCLDVGDCCSDFKDYCGGKYRTIFFLGLIES